jgi:hypothetical protein
LRSPSARGDRDGVGARASAGPGKVVRRRDPAPVLAPIEPDRDGEAIVPVGGIGHREGRGGDEVEVLGVGRGPAGPIIGARQGHCFIDHHSLFVCSPRLIVYPDRDARSSQRLDPACPTARCALVGNQPDIDPALFGPDQRLNDARPGGEAIGANEDLVLGMSIGRIAKAAQSSSGAKQTATAASDVTEGAGSAGDNTPKTSEITSINTLRLYTALANRSIRMRIGTIKVNYQERGAS